MASAYRPRIADAELRACLAAAGAVVIEGPKACGKTRLAQQLAASMVLLDVDIGSRQVLAVDPGLVLAGPRPRLLDEWQVEPALWNQVRRAVDAVDEPGQFLLTGSAVPADDAERHTGAGRFSFLRLRPMTLLESGAGRGGISLAALLAGEPARGADPGLAVADLVELVCRGGWPAQLDRPVATGGRMASPWCRWGRWSLERAQRIWRIGWRRVDPSATAN
jgi:predicted AAA+ superfamily ATPase